MADNFKDYVKANQKTITDRQFVKRPIEIRAHQMIDTSKGTVFLPTWLRIAFASGVVYSHYETAAHEDCIFVKTTEGDMKVKLNDWIIEGIEGELYPCKPSVFEKTYDEVSRAGGEDSAFDADIPKMKHKNIT